MPFFESNEINYKIDFSHCTPVSVISNFNPEGKILPIYIALTDLYNNTWKTKIDGVKYTKDKPGCISYCCVYTVGRFKREIMLTYYIKEHLWVMEN
jgi:hypothetical protein